MDPILQAVENVINNNLYNYLKDYPWLTGYLGNPHSSVWFICENPSLRGVENVHNRHSNRTENLQWNSHSGDQLFRETLTAYGFKSGDPYANTGWNCFITNAVKEPDVVKERNEKKRNQNYWQEQALLWLPVLQMQIDNGDPRILVAIGNQALTILDFMRLRGLVAPEFDQIPHYSYIMKRPDRKTKPAKGSRVTP